MCKHLTGSGISLRVRTKLADHEIEPTATPRGSGAFYTYVHRDVKGVIFYVGKGQGKRAWSLDRHELWHRYRTQRSQGHHTIQIVEYFASSKKAEAAEERLISHYGLQLVNWSNPKRRFDYKALEQFHILKAANLLVAAEAKVLEKTDLIGAIRRYEEAFSSMWKYSHLKLEHGLLAELMAGDDHANPNILDRLTLCLARAGRHIFVIQRVNEFENRSRNTTNQAYISSDKRRAKAKAILSLKAKIGL